MGKAALASSRMGCQDIMGVVYHDGNFDFVCDDIRTPEDHLGKVLKVDCLNKIALGSYSSYILCECV